jgi:hypothetical protein
METWRKKPRGNMTAASINSGAVMVSRPAGAPLLKVSVTIRMVVGPGIEATEKPNANANEKDT